MVFLIPIIAIIILVWAIDAIYFSDKVEDKSMRPLSKSVGNQTVESQNYLDKYIKK